MAGWYLTPQRLHYMHLASLTLCWKGCQVVGTYEHCWWECTSIKSFWIKIVHQIFLNTSYRLATHLSILVLDLLQDRSLSPNRHKLISILCSAARLVTAKNWKSHNPLSIESWYNALFEICLRQKLSASFLSISETPSLEFFLKFGLPFYLLLQLLKTF